MGLAAGLVANLLIIGIAAYAAFLNANYSDFYYRSAGEDEYIEWATFWAFIGATAIGAMVAVRQWKSGRVLPWFAAGVSLFCLFVAMEEISWGQRVLGYRPPVYFLENNFQQEFNVHNVFSTDIRKLVLKAVILGYGVVLPLLGLLPPLRRLLERIAVVVPSAVLVPAFAATYALYEWYPWKYSGETVELMLGLGFLFAALISLARIPRVHAARWAAGGARPLALAAVWAGVLGLGLGNAQLGRIERSTRPAYVELARVEVRALKDDFLALARANRGRLVTRCDLHKRVYTYERKYRKPYLLRGRYADLVGQGMPEQRAAFFLDPWNNPYWIRDRCDSDDSDARHVFVYSFGPNRRRDSSGWEIRDDDVGAYIRR